MGRKMKDSGVEWIGEIPEDWQINKLKYVADFEPSSREKESKLDEEDLITYTPMECIKNGKFDNRSIAYGKVSTSLTRFQEGDICIAKVTPCFENGNIAIMENLHNGFGMGSSELFVIRPKEINKKYIFYWLMNQDFVQHGCATMTGTGGLKRVDSRYVKNTYLHYPSYLEQEKIGRYLDEKCSEIDKNMNDNYNSIECYKSLKQSLITRAVTKGVRGKREMKDSGIEWIGEIPAEWKLAQLGRFVTISSGISVGRIYPPETELVEVPYLRVANVQGDHIDLSDVAVIKVTKEEAEKYKLHSGSLLMTEGGDRDKLGRGSLWSGGIENCIHQNHVFEVCPNENLLVRFLDYVTTSDVARIYFDITAKKTTNLACTNKTTILKFKLPIPSVNEQQEIISYLDEKCNVIDNLIIKKKQLLTELEAYKKSIIYEYVTGKREVLA